MRANILQRRIFALVAARRAAGKPCFIIGLKPRKRGFSTAVSAIHYTTVASQQAEGVIVGNKLETSATIYNMLATFAQNDPLALQGKWSSGVKVQAETCSWQHGSKVAQSTAIGRDSIRGQTPQIAHGSEVAHWQDEEGVFLALMNAIPDDTNVFVCLESTPAGRAGAFYQRWKDARWPAPTECPIGQADYWKKWAVKCPDQPDAIFAEWEFVRVFAAWFEFDEAALTLDDLQRKHLQATLDEKSWYHGEKALIEAYGNVGPDGKTRLGTEVEGVDVWQQLAWRRYIIKSKCNSDPLQFDQEYPRDPESCFLASGRAVFDSDALEHYAAEAREPEFGTLNSNLPEGAIDRDGERATWRRTASEDALFWVWEHPRIGCRYLIVLDTAEGEDQTGGKDPDRHSCLVIRHAYRAADGSYFRARVVARIRPPCRVPITTLVEWVQLLHLYYQALVIPEMNSSGLAYITGARMRGTPIWKRKDFNPRSGKKEEKMGWRTTDSPDYGGIRTVIIENLASILRERLLDLQCAHVAHELGVFVDKNGRKEAASGEHDDDVMALAIGLYNLDAATAFAQEIVPRVMPADLRALTEGQSTLDRGRAHYW